MLRSIVFRSLLPAAILFFLPSATNAQYVYLDANGDGVWTTADRMNPNGTPTTVDAWIDTNHNRNGSLAVCNTGDGDLGFWNSYAVNLGTPVGTVSFTNFINRQPSFDIVCVDVGADFMSNSTEMTACRATATSEAGGLKKMFTVTVTGQSGTPTLQYMPLGGLSPNFTSFGTPCSGNDFDNTYKLGSDFFDNVGLGPAGGVGSLPPQITCPTTMAGFEDSPVTIAAFASDPDAADQVTLSQTNNASFLSGPASAGPSIHPAITLTGTPSFTQAGSYTINWSAADDAPSPIASTAITSVEIANKEGAPVITAPATASGKIGTLITFTVAVSDPDGDAIATLTGSPLPRGSTFTVSATRTSGTFSWVPAAGQAGVYSVLFRAANSLTGTTLTTITVTGGIPSDRLPLVTAPGAVSCRIEASMSFVVSATDPDGDAISSLVASGSALAAGATFAANSGNTSGTLSWTPAAGQAGTYSADFTAANALAGTAATTIQVFDDRAPTVTAPATKSGKVQTLMSFVVSATDPDGDAIASLSASGSALTAGATFAANTGNTSGTLSWTPAVGQAGSYSATFTAANALAGTAATAIQVFDDRAPTVTAPATKSGMVLTDLFFTVLASDPDGESLTRLYTPSPPDRSNFTTNAANTVGTFSWTPIAGQEGTYTVQFVAENALAGSAQTAITIAPASGPANSPFMFMDTNGDRVFTDADRLNANGHPTMVDVWVSTTLSRAGEATVCNTFDGSLGTWNSYVTNIGVSGGTVTFGAPTNQQPTFTIPAVPFQSNDTEMAYAQAGLPIAAGLQRMFTIEVTGVSGSPSLTFLPYGHFGPDATSFGTPCSGLDYDNTYKLGSDWVEAFGALPDDGVTPVNLVGNPSFETSTVGWGGLDGATIQRVEGGHDGGHCLEVRGPTGSTAKFSVNDSPNWVAQAPATGTVYRFTAWVRSEAPAGSANLRVRQYLNKVLQGTSYSPSVVLGPTWQMVTFDVKAAAAGVTLDLQIMDAPIASGEVFQTDDVSIFSPPDGAPPVNLVGNPSFETSTAGWGGLDGGTIQRVEGGHDGGHCLEVRGPAGSTAKFSVNDSPNWVAQAPATGAVYRFTAWVRSEAPAGSAKLRVRQYLNKVLQGTSYSPPVGIGPAWQMVTFDVTAAAAGVTLDLQVMDAPIAPGEVFQTDDISIRILSGGSLASRTQTESEEMKAVMAPNPLNPEAVLSFTTREAGPVRVHIYSATGRHVRTLDEPATSPGRQTIRFNGMDASGRRLASGIYFYRIEAGSLRTTGRFAVVK